MESEEKIILKTSVGEIIVVIHQHKIFPILELQLNNIPIYFKEFRNEEAYNKLLKIK